MFEPLSGLDACFLYVETPAQPQHVTLVAVLDPAGAGTPVGFDEVRAHIAGRLHRVPPLTRRLAEAPWRLHHPHWVADPDIDVDRHVRRAELSAPGDDGQLAAAVAQVAAVPLDRSRPLWEMWVVEGLAEGRFALVAKLHHATLDGVAGVEQMLAFFDLEPVVDAGGGRDDPHGAGSHAPAPHDEEPHDADQRPSEEPPSELEVLTYAAVSRARSLLRAIPLAARTAGSVRAVRDARRSTGTGVAATPLVTPRTPLNDALTPARRVAFARLPLDDVKQVKAGLPGATVNDVVLAVCAGALRRYLDARGELPDAPLVAACPVDVRGEGDRGRAGNHVSAMFCHLPTDVADPAERLAAARRASTVAKEEHGRFDPDVLRGWTEVADPTLTPLLVDLYARARGAGRHRPPVNLVISNVVGPPMPLYLAGAELVRAYPLGQLLEGIGLNITVMSYRDAIDLGFLGAGDLVSDLDDLAAAVPDALAELVAATT